MSETASQGFGSSQALRVVILAAGQGKRMGGGDLPKVLHPLSGRPMIERLLESVESSGVDARPVLVVGHLAEKVMEICGESCEYARQERQLGTGDAVRSALRLLGGSENVLVLNGDMPLMSGRTVRNIADRHLASGATMTVGTVTLDDFEGWREPFGDFGRIVRGEDGRIVRIVEKRDATEAELEIREVNPGIYAFRTAWLAERVERLTSKNSQGEYYLTDLLETAMKERVPVTTVPVPAIEAVGVNTKDQLVLAERVAKGEVDAS